METYYIQWSSWFDSHKYDSDKMIKAVLKAEGKNPFLTNQYGWGNMPSVVAFNIYPENLDKVKIEVQKVLGTEWIIINEVDWNIRSN